jgi:hypothetical protein
MALMMLLLTAWVALGVAVLLLLNLAKWAMRSFVPAAPALRPVDHSRAPANRAS